MHYGKAHENFVQNCLTQKFYVNLEKYIISLSYIHLEMYINSESYIHLELYKSPEFSNVCHFWMIWMIVIFAYCAFSAHCDGIYLIL